MSGVPIYVVKRPKTIRITGQAVINIVPTVTPFSFTATEGQSVFTLAATPTLLHYVAINGVIQRQNTDYTISGAVITLVEGVDAGTIVFGQYQ